jgi:hypothetical protein
MWWMLLGARRHIEPRQSPHLPLACFLIATSENAVLPLLPVVPLSTGELFSVHGIIDTGFLSCLPLRDGVNKHVLLNKGFFEKLLY